jgi:hypothetical protein
MKLHLLVVGLIAALLITACAPARDGDNVIVRDDGADERDNVRVNPDGPQTTINVYENDKETVVVEENVELTTDMEEAEQIARAFVLQSSTYRYDGSNLRLIGATMGRGDHYVFTYTYQSSHAGYGDRSDGASATAMTDHTIVVTVQDGRVTSAEVDEMYDELNRQVIVSEESDSTTTVNVYDDE